MENNEAKRIPRDIEHYFGFLHDRGYRMQPVEYSPEVSGNWVVTFVSPAMWVYITNDRGRIILELSPAGEASPGRRITIERLISTLSDGRDIVVPFRDSMGGGKRKQLERLARLLEQRLVQLAAYYTAGPR